MSMRINTGGVKDFVYKTAETDQEEINRVREIIKQGYAESEINKLKNEIDYLKRVNEGLSTKIRNNRKGFIALSILISILTLFSLWVVLT